MGNSMRTISGPEVPARGTGPIHARHTAGGPTTSRADQNVPVQTPGMVLVPQDYKSGQADQQLADAVNSNVRATIADGHAARDVEAPGQRDEKPGSTESSVREGKRPGLAPDSGYGPSLRAEELDTPKQRLTYIVRCPIARAIVGTRPSCVTLVVFSNFIKNIYNH